MAHLLRDDLADMRSDISRLKSDVSVLKSDVSELKTDVKAINRNLITDRHPGIDGRCGVRCTLMASKA